MTDVKNKKCKNTWCFTLVGKKFSGYCLFCYIHMFPDKPVFRNYKTKESAVAQFIVKEFPNFTWSADQKVQDGCSRRRPDLLLDLGYQVIIVEIDENQHIDYDCSCENRRLMEISKDLGHRPIVFIRFNPDEYQNKDIAISSCWKVNSRGLCVINKPDEWQARLNVLKIHVIYWSNPQNKTSKIVEVIQLFYDVN